ncbi:hypothetical protein GX51_04128 [Blastomyces parvus]|uniref:Uncharacterized protein n=1 Tax=Blastomyces parvus TaxID=2060905 RepID=A0A2B7X3R5_9EURO|nr:hypothetical protein GX51_04128 [Blastomyces parvus]
MTSTSQQQQQPPQPSNPDFPLPHHHLSNSAQQQQQQHNLAVAASTAAGYAADNHLAGLVEAATAAAGQDVGWAQNEDGDASMMGHGRALQNHLDAYPGSNAASGAAGGGLHLDDGFVGDPGGNGQVHFGGMASGAGTGTGNGSVDGVSSTTAAVAAAAATRQLRHANVGRVPAALPRKRKRAGTTAVNVDPAMTGGVAAEGEYDDGSAAINNTGTAPGAGSEDDHMITDGDQNGGGHGHGHGHGLDIRELPPQQALSDARAAGVHSAAALFRQPSATSKKYTRPPMSKMFSSLGLSPENFLHLQAAAKAYMLDPAHPGRRDCVGQRGKGDTEMVKLRLWNCVRDFLDREGNGERFFGEGVGAGGSGGGAGMMGVGMGMGLGVGVESRPPLVWPRDEQRIISLVMPLLRRMVTNERQRQYAIETRKGGAGAEEKKKRRQMGEGVSTLTPERGFVSQQQQQQHQQQQHHGGSEMELGLLDLLTEGYPTDWESIARSYDSYNTDYRLDNLGSISGLQQADWWGLVAAIDCHYQVYHSGNASECDSDCEACTINHIVSSDSVSQAGWRVGMGSAGGPLHTEDLAARNYFATGITRDVTHIIRDNIINHHQQQQQQQPSPPSTSPATSTATATTAPQIPAHQITIHINTTNPSTKGTKRLIPRLDISADQCPDLASLLQKVREHHIQFQQQHHNGQHQSQQAQQAAAALVEEPTLPVKVWLEEGLVDVQTDAEWMVALGKVSTVDWMDGELRVLIVQGGGGGGGDVAGKIGKVPDEVLR